MKLKFLFLFLVIILFSLSIFGQTTIELNINQPPALDGTKDFYEYLIIPE